MTIKQAMATNSNQCADDLLEDMFDLFIFQTKKSLDNCSCEKELNERVAIFCLLYLCDKMDSIDTRLYHLCQREKKAGHHE